MDFDDMPNPNNYQEAASDQPTEEGISNNLYSLKIGGFDSDAMLDPPEQKVGDTMDVSYDGKVKKEILEVGEGVKKPKMNYLATIVYKAYFFDHEVFDSSNEQPVQLNLGDISWPEGLWKGIQEMRKNELAKIKIKRKYGFGRKENVDKLKFPLGYEEEGPKRERLMKKGIIYEVKLLDWVERIDIEADGNFLKTFINKPESKEWERPSDRDEINVSFKVYYEATDPLIVKENWETHMADPEIFLSLRKILESLKRSEHSIIQIKHSFLTEEDQALVKALGDKYRQDQDLLVDAQLHQFIKVEDWFKDGGTCLKRILRKGKGNSPNTDSTIKVRMRITVNDQVVLNNYEEGEPTSLYDQSSLSDEQKEKLFTDSSLYTFILDKYNLPSIILKVLKSMKRNEVCEFIVNKGHTEKLKSNFANQYFDQSKLFNEGDKVKFLITLVDLDKDTYFYQLPVAGKLARVQHLKEVAGSFFKVGNFKKAAKIYQKINGYYNFGDSTNNYQKEDENSEEFQAKFKELQALKIVSFMNLVVCKYKLKEYQSIIGITDQVLEMDPNNIKCLYFRGKAFLEVQEFNNGVQCLQKLVQLDPNHVDGRNELARAKKIRKDYLEDQHKKFSKFFS